MLKKWHIFSFVSILFVLGVFQQYHSPKANQEIVIQFLDSTNSNNSEESITKITEALEQIGVNDVSITSNKNRFYTIAYYSNKSIKDVKKNLSDYVEIGFEKSSNKNSKQDYNLEVFKIKSGETTSWDFEGQEVTILNIKSDRSFNPEISKFPFSVEENKTNLNFDVAYNATKLPAFLIDNLSFNLPEVRAGPIV